MTATTSAAPRGLGRIHVLLAVQSMVVVLVSIRLCGYFWISSRGKSVKHSTPVGLTRTDSDSSKP